MNTKRSGEMICKIFRHKNVHFPHLEAAEIRNHTVSHGGSPFSKYIRDTLSTPDSWYFSKSDQYPLPGFPGIKYYFRIQGDQEPGLDIDINNFHDAFDNKTEDTSFCLIICTNECAGCAACSDKIFVVRVEGTITVKKVDYLPIELDVSWEDQELYDKNNTKDFVVIVEGKQIRVHKSILIKNSTVFARMLDSDKWKETTENKIVIPEFSFKNVEFAIKAFYGMNYFFDFLEKEDYLPLFQFSDKYDMERLKDAIKNNIVLTPSTVVEYANFFLQIFAGELVICCIDYILDCKQNSLPIKDIEMLDAQIRSMFFNRVLVSPVFKKVPKVEHRTVFDATE